MQTLTVGVDLPLPILCFAVMRSDLRFCSWVAEISLKSTRRSYMEWHRKCSEPKLLMEIDQLSVNAPSDPMTDHCHQPNISSDSSYCVELIFVRATFDQSTHFVLTI